jgi:DNA-binding GntR family transcriptional regulator
MSTSAANRVEEVYAALRIDLLNGVFQPGQKLKTVELGERFGVSQSVVREALLRLTEQNLLVAEHQRGVRVRDLSVEDIVALTEARVHIESLALRWSIERGDLSWETDVLSAHHRLDKTPVQHENGKYNEEWTVRHGDFHRSLLAGCGNPRLEAVANSLRDSAELYRRWYWVLTDDRKRDIRGEHADLKKLALARDVESATTLLVSHIERAPRQLIAYAEEHGVDRFDVGR